MLVFVNFFGVVHVVISPVDFSVVVVSVVVVVVFRCCCCCCRCHFSLLKSLLLLLLLLLLFLLSSMFLSALSCCHGHHCRHVIESYQYPPLKAALFRHLVRIERGITLASFQIPTVAAISYQEGQGRPYGRPTEQQRRRLQVLRRSGVHRSGVDETRRRRLGQGHSGSGKSQRHGHQNFSQMKRFWLIDGVIRISLT